MYKIRRTSSSPGRRFPTAARGVPLEADMVQPCPSIVSRRTGIVHPATSGCDVVPRSPLWQCLGVLLDMSSVELGGGQCRNGVRRADWTLFVPLKYGAFQAFECRTICEPQALAVWQQYFQSHRRTTLRSKPFKAVAAGRPDRCRLSTEDVVLVFSTSVDSLDKISRHTSQHFNLSFISVLRGHSPNQDKVQLFSILVRTGAGFKLQLRMEYQRWVLRLLVASQSH
jgi:hypothetical protein